MWWWNWRNRLQSLRCNPICCNTIALTFACVHAYNESVLAAQFEQFSETRKAKEIRTIMDKLWGSRFDESIIANEDYKFWKMAATVVDKGYYERMGRSIFNPSKRIFLAGDYLDLYGFPLGIHAALKSGQLGGNEILKFLSVE